VGARGLVKWAEDRVLNEGELATRAVERGDPALPGQLATFLALVLYLALPRQLTIGPNWLVPLAEALALGTLILAGRAGRGMRVRREAAIVLVLTATVANLVALAFLVHYLIVGGKAVATDLIAGGVLIWATNLALFAVLYWELDRGGPYRPGTPRRRVAPDFLFPQMTVEGYRHWTPHFLDYLYVSLTNQTAFSPTDAMPLTQRAKVLMGIQGVAALVTTGVIVARAVNILGA
jgi:hypothetical protein